MRLSVRLTSRALGLVLTTTPSWDLLVSLHPRWTRLTYPLLFVVRLLANLSASQIFNPCTRLSNLILALLTTRTPTFSH